MFMDSLKCHTFVGQKKEYSVYGKKVDNEKER
jgi:hypothetical protein